MEDRAMKALGRIMVAVAALAAGMAWAHPGHGTTGGTTLYHLFTEPDHVLAILSVIGVAVAAIAATTGGEQSHRQNKRRGE